MLAGGAPIRRALTLHELLDRGLAHAAGLPGAFVDEQALPKIAGYPLGIDVVAKRRAADPDGFGQHVFDGLRQGFACARLMRPRGAARRNACAKQRFARIDVARRRRPRCEFMMNCLMATLRRRVARYRYSASNSLLNGSGPSFANSGCASGFDSVQCRLPKRRGSWKRRTCPVSRRISQWSCSARRHVGARAGAGFPTCRDG